MTAGNLWCVTRMVGSGDGSAGTTAALPHEQILKIEDLLSGARPDLSKSSLIEGQKEAREIRRGGQGTLDLE